MSSQQNAILEVKYYASNTVDENGLKIKDDGEDKCWDMYYSIDKVLNRISRKTKDLTDFLLLGIFRSGEPFLDYDEEQECPFIRVNYEFEYILK